MTDIATDLAVLGLKARPEQVLMSEWMAQDAADGMISLVEAPPATGKTLTMLHHALRLSERTKKRVVLSVPTLSILNQVIASGRRLATAIATDLSIAPVYGRQEYVSPDAVEEWLERFAPAMIDVFRAWRSEQDHDGWTRSSLDDAFRAAGYEVDLGPETTLLSRRHPEPEAAYRRQYETDADVVVCTHVLLGRDVATRIGRRPAEIDGLHAMILANERRLREETVDDRILPAWRHLIVDEAHQLAAGFMMALTSRLSFRRLISILDERSASGMDIPQRPFSNLRRMVGQLENGSDAQSGRRSRRLSMDSKYDRALARSVEQCIPADPSVLGGTDAETSYLRHFREAIVLSQRGRSQVAPSIVWSEVHRHLGLTVAPLSFGRHLDFCFRSSMSAALLSATLYAHDDDRPYDHLARQLMLPADRLRPHDAISSDWQLEGVTLHLPEGEMARDLDPRRRDWTSSLAETVALAAEDSLLGMLVLCTSHETIEDLVTLLAEDHADRLVLTDERGVSSASTRYVEAARAGMRPIWLATGPAWTGLDLPEDAIDLLLIPRLPYGLSNPMMHEHFMGTVRNRIGFRDAETDMLKMLRQGIGRLVRDRESRRERSLWVMDGRLDGEKAGMRARSMLSAYGEPVAIAR